MTTLKMIIAVVGSLVFLGIFSVASDPQVMAFKSCNSETNTQIVSSLSLTCAATNNTLIAKKG
jgi:hypothetical protein